MMNRDYAHSILETIPLGMAIIRREDRQIVWASHVLRQMFADRGDPIGRSCHDYFLRSHTPCEENECPLHHEGKSVIDIRHAPAGIVPKIQAVPLDEDYFLYTLSEESELYRTALASMKELEEKMEGLLEATSTERRTLREATGESLKEVRKEIEVLNRTLTTALLDLGKTASSIREEVAGRRSESPELSRDDLDGGDRGKR